MIIRKILLCLGCCLLVTVAFARSLDSPQIYGDSIGIKDVHSVVTYFRTGVSRFEPNYKDNGVRLDYMRNYLRDLLQDNNVIVDSLVVRASASPEGNPFVNWQLSVMRSSSIYDQLYRYFPELAYKIITYSIGEDWEGLYHAIVSDPDVPNKDEVLAILEVSSDRQAREFFLRGLNDGNAWRYIEKNILPMLRSGLATLVYYRRFGVVDLNVTIDSLIDDQNLIDSLPLDTPRSVAIGSDTAFVAIPPPSVADVGPLELGRSPILDSLSWSTRSNRPTWALKSNFLYWTALQGNIEAEFYINDRWSLNFEYQVAWWSNPARHQYYQYMQCGPEGRYWFKSDGQFRGSYIGLHVGFGLYDLSWGIKPDQEPGLETYPDYQGYQGEFAIALGISYGHVWKLGEYLNLELGFGFGYIMTEYRRYTYQDSHYVYQATERMQFVGPTKARLTLLWQFGRGNVKGWRR